MKGQKLSELLNDIDDDLLADAMPPAWKAGRVRTPKKERHPLRTLGRIMDSGWTAAVLSAVVAIGVIVAIVMAGRAAGGPGVKGDGPDGQPAGQPGVSTESPNEEWTNTTDLTVELPPVTMHMNGGYYLVDRMVGLADRYMLNQSVMDLEKGEGYDADGLGALYQLPELAPALIEKGTQIPSDCTELSFTVRESDSRITGIVICSPDGEQISSVSDSRVRMATLRATGFDGCILVVRVKTESATDTYSETRFDEYPVYVAFPLDDDAELPDPIRPELVPLTLHIVNEDNMGERRSITTGYLLSQITKHPSGPDFEGPVDVTLGDGVATQIDRLRDRLDHDPLYVPDDCSKITIVPQNGGIMTRVQAFTYDAKLLLDTEHGLEEPYTLDVALFRDAAPEYAFFVVITVREITEEDGLTVERLVEYPAYLKLTGNDIPAESQPVDPEQGAETTGPVQVITTPTGVLRVENTDGKSLQEAEADTTFCAHVIAGFPEPFRFVKDDPSMITEHIDEIAVISVEEQVDRLSMELSEGRTFFSEGIIFNSRLEMVGTLTDAAVSQDTLCALEDTTYYLVFDFVERIPLSPSVSAATDHHWQYVWCVRLA